MVDVTYAQTGKSQNTNALGMREMQAKAYEQREAQYLLLKAPPASGKSRALMFIALDKLNKQGLKKAIIAVPERSIGASFQSTPLSQFGFDYDWQVHSKYNLCTPGGDKSKVKTFQEFMVSPHLNILICTHATLRFAFKNIDTEKFNDCLIAIDEFHHVSAGSDNQLGEVVRSFIDNAPKAHIVAMTGSYFRGDAIPVLRPKDEDLFTKCTYSYYEQLNGYKYLKSLGIGYHFYQGRYIEALSELLDTDKKTILHIPNVNAGESTKDKYGEVDFIIDTIGEYIEQDEYTKVIKVKRHKDGKIIKVADLVNDEAKSRDKIVEYLRNIKHVGDIDLIIALGMAKEGFDWPYCEHALTVGYRGSLTEIVQIIGRCTRDSENKSHAQFTNLIAQPKADDEDVMRAVNDLLKAVTSSLLMEQVLAPNFKFKTTLADGENLEPGSITVGGLKKPKNKRVKKIIEDDFDELKAHILQNPEILKALIANADPEFINKILVPKIIEDKYPDLDKEEIEIIRQHFVVDSVIKGGEEKEADGHKFIRLTDKFINIKDLHIDLIDKINPFQRAYEILSKELNKDVFRVIQNSIDITKVNMSKEEAAKLWPQIKSFYKEKSREPSKDSADPLEVRMAMALSFLRNEKQKRESQN